MWLTDDHSNSIASGVPALLRCLRHGMVLTIGSMKGAAPTAAHMMMATSAQGQSLAAVQDGETLGMASAGLQASIWEGVGSVTWGADSCG